MELWSKLIEPLYLVLRPIITDPTPIRHSYINPTSSRRQSDTHTSIRRRSDANPTLRRQSDINPTLRHRADVPTPKVARSLGLTSDCAISRKYCAILRHTKKVSDNTETHPSNLCLQPVQNLEANGQINKSYIFRY